VLVGQTCTVAPNTNPAGPCITELRIADDPELWNDLGFRVGNGRCRVGTVDLVLSGSDSGRGITGWTWAGVAAESRPSGEQFGRIDTQFVDAPAETVTAAPHPNSVIGMFYVVLFGPSHAEAAAAVARLGVDMSKPIVMGAPDQPRLRSLAPAGGIEVEVIGPETADPDSPGKWRLWGVIIEVDDLDKSAGSSLAIAFMSEVHR